MLYFDEFIGTFDVSCDQLRVSDPCYESDSEGGFSIQNVLPGQWKAYIDWYSNDTISALCVVSQEHNGNLYESCFEEIADVGVDSGQLGVFDKVYYNDNQGGEYDQPDTFYGKCCNATSSEQCCGVIDDRGFVSSSGYGDGSYHVQVAKNSDGSVYAVLVDFIYNEDGCEDEY